MFNKRGMASTSTKGRNFYGQTATAASSKTSGKGAAPAVCPGSPEPDPNVIPHIRLADNLRILPKYTAAVGRAKEELLPVEDLDAIQLELEHLLSNVALRHRVLKSEYESMEKDEKRNDRRSKYTEKQPTSPGKRKRVDDSRKQKIPQFKLVKTKNSSASSPAQSQHNDDSMDAVPQQQTQTHPHPQPKDQTKFSVPKNDTPNKFWLSVEPYCMPLTNEDLKLLEDLMEQYSGPLVPPIPDLGPHYSTIWAAEDLKEEQESSSANNTSKSRTKSTSNTETNGLLKKGEKVMGEGVTGPLTQRLISAFIDENMMAEGSFNADSNSSSENTNSTNSTLRSTTLMKNGIDIEKRLKKELMEQGILEAEDMKEEPDEVLSEIKRVLSELTAIAEFNSTELKRLHAAGKAELQRLQVKRKLDAVDQEIVETYKKVVIAKQKQRPLTTEEQDEIYRLTAEQKRLSDQLEAIPMPGPGFDD